MLSFQKNGRGVWYIKLTKLKQQQVSPTSVRCDCASSRYRYSHSQQTCALEKHAAELKDIKKDQQTLQSLNSLLPMNMRPLQPTNADGGVECLGEKNSVDLAFLNAVASGAIIDVDL